MRRTQSWLRPRARATARRRGATTVLVAVVSVVLVAMAAFAVDLSRLQLGVNELQTTADAAAMRAATIIQAKADSNPRPAVIGFASRYYSAIDNTPVAISNSDIQTGWWTDSTRTFDSTWVGRPNAARVRAAKTANLLFGRFITRINGSNGTLAMTPGRRAVSWVGNVISISCPAPWAFPMDAFNKAVYGTTNDFVVRSTAYDDLLALLRSPGALRVTLIMYPAGGPVVNGGYQFGAVDENDGGGTNMNDYADQIANPTTCGANASAAINQTESFPGQGTGSVPMKTVNGAFGGGPAGKLASLCEKPANNSRMVDCYPVGSNFQGAAGVDVSMAWMLPVAGTNTGTVKALGGFRVMCVFGNTKGGGTSTNNGNGNGGGPPETCAWYTSFRGSVYAPNGLPNELPEGTIVGYPVPLGPGPSQNTAVGDAPSLGKKLVLVN